MACVCNLQPSVWLSWSYLSLISLMHAVCFSHLTFLHGFRGVCFCCFCRYGDMRVMMAYELFSMWQNLGECLDSLCLSTLFRSLFLHFSAHAQTQTQTFTSFRKAVLNSRGGRRYCTAEMIPNYHRVLHQ